MNGETVYQTVLKAPRSVRRITEEVVVDILVDGIGIGLFGTEDFGEEGIALDADIILSL